MKKCPACSFENSDDTKFCNSCGRQIPISDVLIKCPKCGKPNPTGADFCGDCGQLLAKKPAVWTIILGIIIFIVVCLLIGYLVSSFAQAAWNAEL